MSFLDRIRPSKLAEAKALRKRPPDMQRFDAPRPFEAALRGPELRAIAEVKRRSPSQGALRDRVDPAEIARGYEAHGAAAISVLTDLRHFGGTLADLEAVREAVSVPVLRKDFLLDEVQIDEAWSLGADAVLLIVAFLSPQRLRELHEHATQLGLGVLVEAHDAEECRVGLDAGARVLGVNNRDLKALTIDLAVCEGLLPSIPRDVVRVAESGVRSPEDARRMRACGADAVLVGSHLMSQADPGRALAELLAL
jgi:indole-3-glycerol phosphate synthase